MSSDMILQEVKIVGSDRYNILIEINPTLNTNFIYDPYFKVYLNKNYRSGASKGVARISMLRPEYIIHYKDSGMNIELTKTQIGFMKVILNEAHNDAPKSDTNWQYMCKYITDIAIKNGIKDVDYKKLEMPKYELLGR